jgi:hypothetical protein
MRKKILMVILTFSVFVLPGFAAAVRAADFRAGVFAASHSENVNTSVPAPEEEKDCAQHLAELLSEGMAIVETSTFRDTANTVVQLNPGAVGFRAAFHLSNASPLNPKAAIIVCQKEVDDPTPEQ